MRTVRVVSILALTGLLLATFLTAAGARRLADSTAGGAPLSAALDGAQEIDPGTGQPGAGDPDATGFAITTLNPGRGEACYELTHDVSPEPFGFHIHVGTADVNGPVVVNFFTDPAGTVPGSGCVEVDRELATEILRHPESYYVNLHNSDFPGGAIRGQLSTSSR